METITVNRFYDMADDLYARNAGEFSITKHFDILTYPTRLQPLRGMTTDSPLVTTGIGNMIVASDGLMYGSGENAAAPGKGKLWYRNGYGSSDVWGPIPNTSQLSGANLSFPLLVEYKDCGNLKTIFWSDVSSILASDPAGGGSVSSDALTFTQIGQGLVHPKDRILYFPYKNTSFSYVASISPNASPFGTKNYTAFSLPVDYTLPCLSYFGNYLAIPAYSQASNRGSMVFLWGRDVSLTTADESLNWGAGQLKVLNNLEGTLIGISTNSANTNGSVQDSDSIYIKGYSGGTEPYVIKEIKAQHLAAGLQPSVAINPNVNFVYKNRLYFSVNIIPNDGVSNSYYGLWSVGKNKRTGRYTVTMERIATNANTETGVLAAAISGDFVSMAHTTPGTLTCTINGQTSASSYGATSVYESNINPEMSSKDNVLSKKLHAVAVHCLPLTTGQQIVMKYRVDSTGAWTTCFTKTATTPNANKTAHETSKPTSGQFRDGRNYEFRLESTGGAVITAFSYKYSKLKTQID